MLEPRDAEQRTVAPDGRLPEQQPACRGDFPVDWPQDQYVARRDFTKFMVLTSFAFVAGQIYIGIQNWFRSRRRERSPPGKKEIATLSELRSQGGVKVFHYPEDNDRCLLVLLKDGDEPRLVAYDQRCTHLSCDVVPHLKDEEGTALSPEQCQLRCPCHHGYFDCATGRPIAGPPRRPLPLIELEVRGNDIYAVGVKERTT